jgi:hypothetical protein
MDRKRSDGMLLYMAYIYICCCFLDLSVSCWCLVAHIILQFLMPVVVNKDVSRYFLLLELPYLRFLVNPSIDGVCISRWNNPTNPVSCCTMLEQEAPRMQCSFPRKRRSTKPGSSPKFEGPSAIYNIES